MPSNPYASEVAFEVGFEIKLYLKNNNMEGHVTGEAGGYVVEGYPVAPDIAYLSKDKHRDLNRKTYNPVPPDLAVEVETNVTKKSKEILEKKIAAYLRAGTVVWVFYPDTQQVKVHAPDKEVVTLGIDDELDGWEMARIMADHPEWQAIPIMIASATVANVELSITDSVNIVCRVTKPISSSDLIDAVKKVS